MGGITGYQWLVSLLLTIGLSLIVNAFVFGRRVGAIEQELKTVREDNAFLKSQFHEMFAVVANDQVYSTAIAYWDSSHFFIFYGVNNTGYLTKSQADELAKEMNASAS